MPGCVLSFYPIMRTAFILSLVVLALLGLTAATQVSVETSPQPCEKNIYFLVDVSGSIKPIVQAVATTLRTLTAVALRRGGLVTVSYFSADGTAGTFEYLKHVRTSADDAKTLAERVKTDVVEKVGGNTDICNGFDEVYAQMEANPDKDFENIVYVLTDGNPNQLVKDPATGEPIKDDKGRVKSEEQTKEHLLKSKFPLIFKDKEKTKLAFVLFGAAAQKPEAYKLNTFFSEYGQVFAVKSIEDVKGRHEAVEQLTIGGCKDPEWATIYFENDSEKIYDYEIDSHEMNAKYEKFWSAATAGVYNKPKPDWCSADKPAQFFIAAFASKAGNSDYNKKLALRRAKSAACALSRVLLNKKCFSYTIELGAFGDQEAKVRKGSSLLAQKADRKVHVYYGSEFIPEFEKFKNGISEKISRTKESIEEYKKFAEVCKADAWKNPTHYWEPKIKATKFF